MIRFLIIGHLVAMLSLGVKAQTGTSSAVRPINPYCQALAACNIPKDKKPHVKFDGAGNCRPVAKPLCGLTAQEVHALQYYTMDGYSCVNGYLRAGVQGPVQGYVDVLTSALAKLPAYRGFVSRGAVLPDHVYAKYEIGAIVDDKAFLSASTHEMTGNAILTILSISGRAIMPVSLFPVENEVLFFPGTRFRVVLAKKAARGLEKNTGQFLLREVFEDETPEQARAEDARVLSLVGDLSAREVPALGEKSFRLNCKQEVRNVIDDPENFPVHSDSFLRSDLSELVRLKSLGRPP